MIKSGLLSSNWFWNPFINEKHCLLDTTINQLMIKIYNINFENLKIGLDDIC